MPKFELVNIDKFIFPTPRHRKEDPAPTELLPGDIVRALIGPAKGSVGIVVIERNGNYYDYEPNADKESIGVGFAEEETIAHPQIRQLVEDLTEQKPIIVNVVRWFDSPGQLEVLAKADSLQ